MFISQQKPKSGFPVLNFLLANSAILICEPQTLKVLLSLQQTNHLIKVRNELTICFIFSSSDK